MKPGIPSDVNQGVGIDFGTTNSVVAVHLPKSGKTAVCTDRETHLPHPSVVWYRLDGKPLVGREAKQQVSSFTDVAGHAFVQSVKRHLGSDTTLDVFGEKKSPSEVASDIFRHLIADAKASDGYEIKNAIVTVPVYFDGRARRALRKAADAAGLYIKTFLHEPFAALIGYLHRESGIEGLERLAGRNILVFDWGGGTLDITIGRVDQRRVVELATSGLSDRAGDYFDELLGALGKRKFLNRYNMPPESLILKPSTRDRYRAQCEQCKVALSTDFEQTLQLAQFFRSDGREFHLTETVDQNEFEREIHSVIEDAGRKVDEALEAAKLSPRQIDLALLVGGSSRVPAVQQLMRDRFGRAVVEIPNADSIIAEGAAIADAYGVQPAFAASVAIELSDASTYEVFKAGDPALPNLCNKSLNLFCTDNRDGLGRLIIGLSGNSGGKLERKKILTMPVNAELPRPYHHERISANFYLDEDLVLQVNAKAATQTHGVHDEIVDLRYALSLDGI